jgi:hypothetical protein
MIINSRLPQLVSIKGLGTTIGDYGEISGAAILFTNVRCRITRNSKFNSIGNTLNEAGYVSESTHIVFMNLTHNGTSLNLKIGYELIISTEIYTINYIDDRPGGVDNHHYQLYCTCKVA